MHLRTLTPFTKTVLHTTMGTGCLTTTAPRGPAQTTALAVRDSRVMVASGLLPLA